MANTDYQEEMDEATARGIAQLLRKPEGEHAIEVGEKMNEGNAYINQRTIEVIPVKKGDHLLEIGMGNGFFVKSIFDKSDSIRYTGVDYAREMVEQSCQHNSDLIGSGLADFRLANVNELPFRSESFDQVFTVNTIYFWDDHEKVLAEIKRVLKATGTLTLSLRPKANMKDFPFVKYGFDMFSKEELCKLLEKHGFEVTYSLHEQEPDQQIGGSTTKVETLIVRAVKNHSR